ncbi:hypothetical protein ALT785_490036 [Alteromonas infernus]
MRPLNHYIMHVADGPTHWPESLREISQTNKPKTLFKITSNLLRAEQEKLSGVNDHAHRLLWEYRFIIHWTRSYPLRVG